jgi:hypothetical protein
MTTVNIFCSDVYFVQTFFLVLGHPPQNLEDTQKDINKTQQE